MIELHHSHPAARSSVYHHTISPFSLRSIIFTVVTIFVPDQVGAVTYWSPEIVYGELVANTFILPR